MLGEAQRHGWEEVVLLATLALGEVEMRYQPVQGRARLRSFEEQARQKGYAGLADRARRAG